MELTKSEKIQLGTKEIAKRIREQVKQEFPACKFSVITEYYSMGSSIHISLMKANVKVTKDFSEIPQEAILRHTYQFRTAKQLEEMQNETYHQLNPHQLRGEFNPVEWCNGVFLTQKGHNLLKRVVEISDQYNFDESDPQTDYFCVNYYLHLNLGKWNKPFIQKT